jgi:hypothetical protein
MPGDAFDLFLRQAATLVPGLPFVPRWNEEGTDAEAFDPAAAGGAPGEPDLVGDLMGTSVAARTAPRTYKRTMPLVDPRDAPELLSPDGRLFVSTDGGNLVARSTADGRTYPLTTDGTLVHEWRFDWADPLLALLGLSVPVTNFSPDGARLAAYKVDNAGVFEAPQMHYLKRADEVVHRYHAKAGGILERFTLHVVDLYDKPPVEIDLGDTTDTYPCFAGWLRGGSELLVFQMSRDCRRVDVLAADAATGRTRRLFGEQGETFVRIHHDIYYGRKLGLTLTPAGDGLLWLSERSGWKHLYLYDLEGNFVRQLTDGESISPRAPTRSGRTTTTSAACRSPAARSRC